MRHAIELLQTGINNSVSNHVKLEFARAIDKLNSPDQPASDPRSGGWLSPVDSERKTQECFLKILFPGYPDCSFTWQYMNALLIMAMAFAAQNEVPLAEAKTIIHTLNLTCHYCGKMATKEMPLVKMRAPGCHMQHWNSDQGKGCAANIENSNPDGVK